MYMYIAKSNAFLCIYKRSSNITHTFQERRSFCLITMSLIGVRPSHWWQWGSDRRLQTSKYANSAAGVPHMVGLHRPRAMPQIFTIRSGTISMITETSVELTDDVHRKKLRYSHSSLWYSLS